MVLHCWFQRAGCISQDTYLLYFHLYLERILGVLNNSHIANQFLQNWYQLLIKHHTETFVHAFKFITHVPLREMDKLWVGVPCSLVFAAFTVFTRRGNIFLIVIRKQGNILLLEQFLRDGHILDCNLQARQHFGANGWRRYFHSIWFQFGLLSNFISLWSRSIYYHS